MSYKLSGGREHSFLEDQGSHPEPQQPGQSVNEGCCGSHSLAYLIKDVDKGQGVFTFQ